MNKTSCLLKSNNKRVTEELLWKTSFSVLIIDFFVIDSNSFSTGKMYLKLILYLFFIKLTHYRNLKQ